MFDTNADDTTAALSPEVRAGCSRCADTSMEADSFMPPASPTSSGACAPQKARRPRLTPAIAQVRRAVRQSLRSLAAQVGAGQAGCRGEVGGQGEPGGQGQPGCGGEVGGAESAGQPGVRSEQGLPGTGADFSSDVNDVNFKQFPLVLVALSGGADSLALAAATAFEAPRAHLRAGAIIVDHGLQKGSAAVATRAARQAQSLGLSPVRVVRVEVGSEGGPEAAARAARYEALGQAASQSQAVAVLLAHTRDDQAETVLLGLARGSGAASLQGMAAVSALYRRPLLGIDRQITRAFCVDSGLDPWNDPQNADPIFARVRVRERVLPVLEAELGPGIAQALARTAEQLREDASALETVAARLAEDSVKVSDGCVSVPVRLLAAQLPALRARVLRYIARVHFGVSWERVHVLAVSRLVTDWHGQRALDLPACTVSRIDGELIFSAASQLHKAT